MVKKEKPVREKPVKKKPVKEKPAKKKPEKEKPVKKRPEKPEKKRPEKDGAKPGLLDRFRKKKDGEDGMDIMTEVKEPFSIQGFFEEHVAEKFRRAKRILQERGVLFFLFSPFQARGRLIAQMLIIVVGVMFGVVPRATSMVNALQQEAYSSEMAGLKPVTVGQITITPAESSNYKRMHMLAFVLSGKNLPSDPEKYEVCMARAYGASDWQDVTYSWDVYPVDDDRRILLVAIDQTKQKSGYGAFNMFIQLKDDEKVSKYAKEAGCYTVTLSSAQPTGPLYDKSGIHLSAISDTICGSGEIEKKQAEFQAALKKYQVAVEQAEAMPIGVKVSPTAEDLETYCLANRVYRHLKDDSNTEDILSMDKISERPKLDYGVSLTAGGIEYDEEQYKDLNESPDVSEEERKILSEYDHVKEAKDAVLAAMENVNLAADDWYMKLDSMKLVLNQTVKVKQFPLYARVVDALDDGIEFIDGEPEEPGDDGPGGPFGEYGGDDADVEKPAATLEPDPEPTVEPAADPELTEEPVTDPEPTVEPAVKPTATPEPTVEPTTEPTRPTYTPHEQTGSPADNK